MIRLLRIRLRIAGCSDRRDFLGLSGDLAKVRFEQYLSFVNLCKTILTCIGLPEGVITVWNRF